MIRHFVNIKLSCDMLIEIIPDGEGDLGATIMDGTYRIKTASNECPKHYLQSAVLAALPRLNMVILEDLQEAVEPITPDPLPS